MTNDLPRCQRPDQRRGILSGGLGSGRGWRGRGVPGEFASGSCSAASSAVRVVAECPGGELDGWRSADQDPVPPVRRNSCSRGQIRATYGGETRRTSKIHWQKGRSTVTGQLTCGGPDSVRMAEPSRLIESGPADRMPGGVSLHLVSDLGMTRPCTAQLTGGH